MALTDEGDSLVRVYGCRVRGSEKRDQQLRARTMRLSGRVTWS